MVGDLGKAHQIQAMINNDQDEHQPTIPKSSCKINDNSFSILIDT
jgi:hypothetical protein